MFLCDRPTFIKQVINFINAVGISKDTQFCSFIRTTLTSVFSMFSFVDVTDNPNISMAVHKDLQSTGPLITKRLARLHDYFDRTSLL